MARIQALKCPSKRSTASANSRGLAADKADLKPNSRCSKRAATASSSKHRENYAMNLDSDQDLSSSSLSSEKSEEGLKGDSEEESEDGSEEESLAGSKDEERKREGASDPQPHKRQSKWKKSRDIPWPKPSNSTVGRDAAGKSIMKLLNGQVTKKALIKAISVYQEVYHKARMERLRAQQIERGLEYEKDID